MFFSQIWALFLRNKLYKNIVSFLFESNGISEVTQNIIIVALLEWVNLESATFAPATPLPWNTATSHQQESNIVIEKEHGYPCGTREGGQGGNMEERYCLPFGNILPVKIKGQSTVLFSSSPFYFPEKGKFFLVPCSWSHKILLFLYFMSYGQHDLNLLLKLAQLIQWFFIFSWKN